VSKPNILWQPFPGVQTEWCACTAFEKLMAGGAGAGKSSCLLADAARFSANPAMRSLILRLSYPMLKDLIAASYLIYPAMKARYNVQQHQWTFPSGAIVEFGAIENTEACIQNFSGRSFTYVGVDEVVQLGADTAGPDGEQINGAYTFLKSRLRAVEGSGLGLTLASTGTPGGVGQAWVRSYFGIGENAQSCETRDPITGTRRAYFHCSVKDNQALANTSYAARLEGLPSAQRKALLHGDWGSFVGQVFNFSFRDHVTAPFPISASWEVTRCCDDGFAAPAACYWLAEDPVYGRTYVVAELWQRQMTPEVMAAAILQIDRSIPVDLLDGTIIANDAEISGVIDSASFAKTGMEGTSRGDMLNKLGCKFSPCEKSAGSRISGIMRIHQALAMKSDGKPGLIIFSSCKQILRTLPSMTYSRTEPEDIDASCERHGCDALAYGLQRKAPRQFKSPKVRWAH
jgi:hypothetical protein